MPADLGPGAVVGWLRARADPDDLAGCAFLIGPDIVLTCAHVIGAHLGLPDPAPADLPAGAVTIRFEALQEEVTGRVLPGGWFSNARPAPNQPSDIAVVRLDQPVTAIAPLPSIARRMPNQSRPVLIHGAEADYKSYGQQVQGKLIGLIPRGWLQIDPAESMRGFTVEAGFSGSPVLDDLGNTVWGMVVAVAENGSGVAYAIPADHLWTVLQSAGAETTVRPPDAMDRRAEAALAQLRADYESQLTERDAETLRMRQELDQLRQGVRRLEQEARAAPDQGAGDALDALAHGDQRPAIGILHRDLEQKLAVAGEARRDAVGTARQLGTMLKFVDSAGALRAFRKAAECDPDDFWTWIEISRLEQAAGTLGGAMQAIDAALSTAIEDELLHAVAFSERGDLLLSQGNLPQGLTSYRDSLTIRDRLANSDPGNAGWQRDLSVSYNKVGDVLAAQGNLPDALKSYRDSLTIADRLAKSDPANAGWQRDLAVFYNKVGDVLAAQGNLPDALKSYRDSLTIADRLAKSDSGNAGWQRNLAVSYNKVGDVLVAQGNLPDALKSYRDSLTIADRLAKSDPGNAGWQRDLSVSYDRVGDVLVAQCNLPDALRSYRDSLTIRDRLAKSDPGNAGWQRDLAVIYERVGDVSTRQGANDKARHAFQQALETYDTLAAHAPDDVQSRIFSVVPHMRLSDLDPPQRRYHLQAALAILKPLAAENRLDAMRLSWLPQIEAQLASSPE